MNEPGAQTGRSSFELVGQRIGAGNRLFLIAGPCVVEGLDTMLKTADALAELCDRLGILVVFKSSFLKANRTAQDSPEGPGLDKGLEILQRVRDASGLAICTDVHDLCQVEPAAEVAQILQIPAFLCRQSELIRAAAATGRVVNIKKGQFMDPRLMEASAGKAHAAGGTRVILTERGSFFGYGDLVVDFRSLELMAESGCPIVFDATHSVQQPGGAGTSSGGQRRFIKILARAAVAAGVDGLFIEVHPAPENALSDRYTQISLEQIAQILPPLVELADYVRERNLPE
ncbi:MAG: 3-deoxy-8-phosphooctulonate synthase [Gemmatimonadota bacterium]|nr:3-deoxy-8-phosphooctulonate synthase [Gemmatimonadota bacterium]